MEQLQELNLRDNKIIKISNKVFIGYKDKNTKEHVRLSELIVLNLSENDLDDISKDIHHLPRLQKLDISDNNIKKITPSIFKLTRLKVLIMSNNNIEKVQKEISHLTNLSTLNLSNNRIKEIPKTLLTGITDKDTNEVFQFDKFVR